MTTETWLKIIAAIIGVPLAMALPALAILGIRYRITERHLVISWLGIPVRWVRLDRIRSVGTTPVWWAERWPNALRWRGRYLVVRKQGWLFKHMIITPRNPFVFRAELLRARDAFLNSATAAQPASPEPAPAQPTPTQNQQTDFKASA
jgi:hypothetical protein